MSDITAITSLIALGLLGSCSAGAWAWIEFEEFRRRRREWRERRGQWIKLLK